MTGAPDRDLPTEIGLLITAAEAYPAMEPGFLEARHSISAGFRIFDPDTRLLSEAARAAGDTWCDLVAYTLARGVRFRLILSDFDPVVRPALHRGPHRSLRL